MPKIYINRNEPPIDVKDYAAAIDIKDCPTTLHQSMVAWCGEHIGSYGNGWRFYWRGNFERDVRYVFADAKFATMFTLRFS